MLENFENSKYDNLFQQEPYNLKLDYRDIFGLLTSLDNDIELLNLTYDIEHELELIKICFECAPEIINNDQDILEWIYNIEKKSPIQDLTISFEDVYPETIKAFKKAISMTKRNQELMSFTRIEKVQDSEALVDFIYSGPYKNENLALLPKHQIEIALKKREEALALLHDIEDMFGELKMQFTKRDENGRLVII